jgi:hypothetical protein
MGNDGSLSHYYVVPKFHRWRHWCWVEQMSRCELTWTRKVFVLQCEGLGRKNNLQQLSFAVTVKLLQLITHLSCLSRPTAKLDSSRFPEVLWYQAQGSSYQQNAWSLFLAVVTVNSTPVLPYAGPFLLPADRHYKRSRLLLIAKMRVTFILSFSHIEACQQPRPISFCWNRMACKE